VFLGCFVRLAAMARLRRLEYEGDITTSAKAVAKMKKKWTKSLFCYFEGCELAIIGRDKQRYWEG
jgi:hypothetical protein